MSPATGIHAHPTRKLGRLPHDPTRRALQLGDYLAAAVPQHPTAVRWQDKPGLVFGLDDNDKRGDCGPTSSDNDARTVTAWLSTPWQATIAQVLDLYARSTNPPFDPTTGANDNGVVLQTMLEALLAGGLGDRKPLAFARLNIRDHDQLRAAIALFGTVILGVDLQTAQQTQTDTGTWDYQPSGEWGGHAIAAVGYDTTGIDVITWAQVIHATDRFLTHQLGEAWVIIWPEHATDRGFLQGVNLAALAADYTALTGRPFPVVQPPNPAPGPAPAPGGDPAAADAALAAWLTTTTAKRWMAEGHRGVDREAVRQLRAWAAARQVSSAPGNATAAAKGTAPRVGDPVHYVAYGTPGGEYPSVCRAALVTAVAEDLTVGLTVFNPTGLFVNPAIDHHPGDPAESAAGARCAAGDRAYPGGTWHWPEQ